MFIPKLSSALVLALALGGAALAAGVHGTYAQETLQRSIIPENPARPNCSTNPYDPNFQMGGCGGGELLVALVQRPAVLPENPARPNCSTNPYDPNFQIGGCGGGE